MYNRNVINWNPKLSKIILTLLIHLIDSRLTSLKILNILKLIGVMKPIQNSSLYSSTSTKTLVLSIVYHRDDINVFWYCRWKAWNCQWRKINCYNEISWRVLYVSIILCCGENCILVDAEARGCERWGVWILQLQIGNHQ